MQLCFTSPCFNLFMKLSVVIETYKLHHWMPNLISCRTMYLFLKLDFFVMEKIELFWHDLAGFRVALSFFSLLSYFNLTQNNFIYTNLFSTNFSTDCMSWLIDNQYFKSGIWSEATDTKHNRSTLAPFFRSRLAALILVMASKLY